jgi:hypothetical protein
MLQVLMGVNVYVLLRDWCDSHAEKEEHDAMRMQEAEIYDYARQLLEAHGAKAVAEAAQKACALGRGDRRLLQRAVRSGPARASAACR